MVFDLLDKLFARGQSNSRQQACDRLKMVLAYDRTADISSEAMNSMRREILQVVKRYFELQDEDLEVGLERSGNTTALIANIPIRRVRRGENDDQLLATAKKSEEASKGGSDESAKLDKEE
jgi:cell division topological specificity factor